MLERDRLGVLLDYAQDKIILLDGEGIIRYANDAAEQVVGYEPAELIGRNAFSFVHDDDQEEATAAFSRTIAADEFTTTTLEYRFRGADGDWVWLQSRMSNLTDDALEGYVVSSRDVTDRVRAESEWQETATRLEEFTEVTGDVFWMFDGDFDELLFVNPAYEDVYGGPVGDLQRDARAFLDLVHPDDREAVRDAMACLVDGNSVDVEYRVNPREDYGVWVWVQGEPIIHGGEVRRITGFTREVTDRRRRERQLYIMDTLLRHTLRNDLNVIMSNAELIEEEFPAATDRTSVIRETGEELLASANKDRQLIDILLEEDPVMSLEVGEVIEESLATAQARFPDARIDSEYTASMTVRASPALAVAIDELLENAVVHDDVAHPSVRVTATSSGNRCVVAVEDSAPPIPQIEADVLAGDYEAENDIYHSSGLGFWLVRWIVELSDGDISVTVTETGNRIAISLPLVTE